MPRLHSDLCGATDAKQYPSASGQRPCWLRCHPEIYDRNDIALFGAHTLKHASNVQTTISLSTGESEYYALVKGGSTALGIQSLLQDLGLDLSAVVESDSNSAKGTVSRIGLGKARHIQARYLWLQDRVAMNHLKVVHVPGKEQSGGRIDQERARGTNAQHDGKIRLPIPDSRAEQGSDEAIGLIVQRPWPDSTT